MSKTTYHSCMRHPKTNTEITDLTISYMCYLQMNISYDIVVINKTNLFFLAFWTHYHKTHT